MSKFIDLTGQKFGHLTVTGYKRKIDSAGASRIWPVAEALGFEQRGGVI